MDIFRVITKAEYLALPSENQERLYHDVYCHNRQDMDAKFESGVAVSPSGLPFTCANMMFPTYEKGAFKVSISDEDVLNGELCWTPDDGKLRSVVMKWKGYASQLYDDQLKLGAIRLDATIEGTLFGAFPFYKKADGNELFSGKFKFEQGRLVEGKWPVFLVVLGPVK
jgi:hypothetical protein